VLLLLAAAADRARSFRRGADRKFLVDARKGADANPNTETNMDDENATEWKTSDLYLSGFLACRPELTMTMARHGRRMIFTFSGPNVAQLRQDYFAGEATVAAFKYAEKIRALKAIVNGVD
jgi:hypothetical protein